MLLVYHYNSFPHWIQSILLDSEEVYLYWYFDYSVQYTFCVGHSLIFIVECQ